MERLLTLSVGEFNEALNLVNGKSGESGIMRVPRTTGRPDTLPGTRSMSSHRVQSMVLPLLLFIIVGFPD
ncbi:MAG: hypothetical protein M3Z23_18150 [Acidobacteriota bacterium]|nr:hypothetical protein [Acidobacteriota bacterium]